MKSFLQAAIEAARLKILELLQQTNGYALNNQVIESGLDAMGMRHSASVIRAELGWLEEVGAVTLMDVGPVVVATLTERGHDIARGLSVVRGIARPVPGSGL